MLNKKGLGKILIVIGILVLLLVLGLVYAYTSITSSKTVAAQLHVESGQVLVNDKIASEKVLLKKGDVIETKDGEATVILYESVIISLDPNTKITLEDLTREHPVVNQEGGETWNKFTNVLGVEDYTIKAGNSVASVRGTAFGITEDKIIVGEGEVDYSVDEEEFRVIEDEVVELVGDKPVERKANPEELEMIKQNMEETIKELKYIRELEIEKQGFLVDKIKAQFELTDEDIRQTLEDADNGLVDIDELVAKSPIQIDSLQKIADITKEIRKIKEQMM